MLAKLVSGCRPLFFLSVSLQIVGTDVRGYSEGPLKTIL
jgi:hypothetical protein